MDVVNENKLVIMIRQFWADKGYRVEVAFEEYRTPGEHNHKPEVRRAIRSDLVNGLPRDWREVPVAWSR